MKNKSTVKAVFLLLILFSTISCLNGDDDLDSIDYYKLNLPNYTYRVDRNHKYLALEHFFDTTKHNEGLNQGLYFDNDGKLLQYVFYDCYTNDPRYIIKFSDGFQVAKQEGDLAYAVSPSFYEEVEPRDSFTVIIYAPTPPNFNVKVDIYSIVEGRYKLQGSKVPPPDGMIVFKGGIKIPSDKKRYAVISSIQNNFQKDFIKQDTVFFTL